MEVNNVRADAIVAAARAWVGTPFKHQGRTRGKSVDCWNLIRAVGEELGLLNISRQDFRPFEGYKRVPGDGLLKKALDQFLERINDAALPEPPLEPEYGDVVLICRRHKEDPKHCGIVGEHNGRLTLIHAASNYGGVVEHGLSDWWAEHIVGIYRYR